MQLESTEGGLAIIADSEEETERIGRAFADLVTPGVVVGLIGPLGAGKTRLVRALAEALGVVPEAISSPTFVLIHEYQGRIPVYHFDAYRLTGPDEFEALGVSDYWSGDGVCLVEWADRVAGLLPADAWIVQIEPLGPRQRRFVATFPAAARLAERLRAV